MSKRSSLGFAVFALVVIAVLAAGLYWMLLLCTWSALFFVLRRRLTWLLWGVPSDMLAVKMACLGDFFLVGMGALVSSDIVYRHNIPDSSILSVAYVGLVALLVLFGVYAGQVGFLMRDSVLSWWRVQLAGEALFLFVGVCTQLLAVFALLGVL